MALCHVYWQDWGQFTPGKINLEERTHLWCFSGQLLPRGDRQDVSYQVEKTQLNTRGKKWNHMSAIHTRPNWKCAQSSEGSQHHSSLEEKYHPEMLPDIGQNSYRPQPHQGSHIQDFMWVWKSVHGWDWKNIKLYTAEHKRAVRISDNNKGLLMHDTETGHSMNWVEAEVVYSEDKWMKKEKPLYDHQESGQHSQPRSWASIDKHCNSAQ